MSEGAEQRGFLRHGIQGAAGVPQPFSAAAREEGERHGGMSPLSLSLLPIPEKHNKVSVQPAPVLSVEGRATLPRVRHRGLGWLATVGGLELAKILQKEILMGSGLSTVNTVFRGWAYNHHV